MRTKQEKRDYMKAYRTRDYVKTKLHEYYVTNKMHWGEITKAKKNNWGGARQESQVIKDLHEKWAIKNGYRDNDNLHAANTERFIEDAKK